MSSFIHISFEDDCITDLDKEDVIKGGCDQRWM